MCLVLCWTMETDTEQAPLTELDTDGQEASTGQDERC